MWNRDEPRDERRDERGQASVLIIGFAVVLAMVVALVVDSSAAYLQRQGLDSLAGHLRARLGKTLGLRSAPEILFRYDESVARAARIDALLTQIKENRPDGDG